MVKDISFAKRYADPEFHAAWNKKIHDRYLERQDMMAILKSKSCTDCYEEFPWYAMEWDHVDPSTKNANVSNMIAQGCNWDKVLDEISKCELVCATCHKIRTYERNQYGKSV